MKTEPAAPTQDTQNVEPDELMKPVAGLGILKPSIVAILLHVVVIVATSIGFVSLCVTYGTWHPRQVETKLAEEERERLRVRAREAARAKLAAEQQEAAKAGTGAADGPTSRTERAITETSDERPSKPDLGPDDLDDLE